MVEFTTSNPTDVIHTILLVTQYLCFPIVSFFVFMRLGVRLHYKQNIGIEDCMSEPMAEMRLGVANVCSCLLYSICLVHGLLCYFRCWYVPLIEGRPRGIQRKAN